MLPAKDSVNYVPSVPKGFTDWVVANKDRIAKAKSMPYFLSNNAGVVNGILGEDVVPVVATSETSVAENATTIEETSIEGVPTIPQPTNAIEGAAPSSRSVWDIAEERHAQRTPERELELRRYWQDKVMKFTPEQLKNFDDIEKALGVKRGLMMTDAEADMQNANPNYGKDRGYSINCQTCAPVYMLRKWGFDVTATSKTPGSVNDYIARGRSPELWRNQDGTPISYETTKQWLHNAGGKRMTAQLYEQYFNEKTKEKGVYCLTIGWKGGGGHATILIRDANNKLLRIEPQHYNGNVYRSISELAQTGEASPIGSRGIFRIDDKIFYINGKTPNGKLFIELFKR